MSDSIKEIDELHYKMYKDDVENEIDWGLKQLKGTSSTGLGATVDRILNNDYLMSKIRNMVMTLHSLILTSDFLYGHGDFKVVCSSEEDINVLNFLTSVSESLVMRDVVTENNTYYCLIGFKWEDSESPHISLSTGYFNGYFHCFFGGMFEIGGTCDNFFSRVTEGIRDLVQDCYCIDLDISTDSLLNCVKTKEINYEVLNPSEADKQEIYLECKYLSLKDDTVNEFEIDLKDFEAVLKYLVKYRGSDLHFEFDYKKVLCTVDSLYNGTNYSKLFGSMPLPEFLKNLGTKSLYADSKLNQTVYDFLVKSERNMFKLSIVDDTVNPATAGSIGCKE